MVKIHLIPNFVSVAILCRYLYVYDPLKSIFLIFSAFSFFSAFEYVIAYSNMGYHVSGYLEFKNKSIISADVISDSVYTNGDTPKVKAITDGLDDEMDGKRRSLRIRKKGAGESVQ